MRAGLADEFAAKPAGRGTPGQLASPALALIYDERAGSLLALYAARDQRTRASAEHHRLRRSGARRGLPVKSPRPSLTLGIAASRVCLCRFREGGYFVR